MGISRDSWHERCNTGGKRKPNRKWRKDELGCSAAHTQSICPEATSSVVPWGCSWGASRASSAGLAKQGLLLLSRCMQQPTGPHRDPHGAPWPHTCQPGYEPSPSLPSLPLSRKEGAKLTPEEEEILSKKRSKKIQKKKIRWKEKECQNPQSSKGAVPSGQRLVHIAARPGQRGWADGSVPARGKELELWLRKT